MRNDEEMFNVLGVSGRKCGISNFSCVRDGRKPKWFCHSEVELMGAQ